MKHVRICHHNTQGLHNDTLVIVQALNNNINVSEVVYEEIDYVHEKLLSCPVHFDINIFLEHIYEAYTIYANVNIFIPNTEWLNSKDIKSLQCIDAVFCKTKDSYEVMKRQFPHSRIFYCGFTSINRYLNIEKKYDYILHMKGISKYKNSQILVDTWQKHPEWPKLVIVHYGIPHSNGVLHFNRPFAVGSNIIVYQQKLDEASVCKLMNQIGVHICPSFSEGFGHYINEACSTGAFVITTDGTPMKDILPENSNILIKPCKSYNVNLGKGYIIDTQSIETAMSEYLALHENNVKDIGEQNRKKYIDDQHHFIQKINDLIKIFL